MRRLSAQRKTYACRVADVGITIQMIHKYNISKIDQISCHYFSARRYATLRRGFLRKYWACVNIANQRPEKWCRILGRSSRYYICVSFGHSLRRVRDGTRAFYFGREWQTRVEAAAAGPRRRGTREPDMTHNLDILSWDNMRVSHQFRPTLSFNPFKPHVP